jgi:hypothetical protein
LLWDRSGIHADDVHALIRAEVQGTEGLITGGKDGRVSFSALDGAWTDELITAPGGRGQHWVTSMAVNAQGLLALGRRSGLGSVWDLREGVRCIAECAFNAVSNDHAKERNQDRIHSMSWVSALEGEEGPQTLVVGLNGRMVRVSALLKDWTEIDCDSRAWVYGCMELDPQRLVVIEGAGLALHSLEEGEWQRKNLMLARMHGEGRDGPGPQEWEDRRFVAGQKLISHVRAMPERADQLVLSQFDGSVTRMDLGQGDYRRFQWVTDVSSWILNDYGFNSAFSRRVWQTIPLHDTVWVAATDDGTLPLIDWRMRGVAQRLSSGGSRVSCVESTADGFGFYAVSCATNPAESGGAHLRAYDMRRS